MSFLQPWMLLALPLAAIPIIIHLINQRRYQTTQWAAMMFLLSANQMNRGYAKIRQWLILAFRALVVAALVIAVGRPLVSGRLGNGVVGSLLGQGSPTVMVLLDRSPSMQQRVGSTPRTKLQNGIDQIASTLQTMSTGRVVLIESNSQAARELSSPDELFDLPQTGPSDASADLPAMLLATIDHINANQLGQVDVWICSDLRSSDWRSEDGRWNSIRQSLTKLGRRVRFRLLALPEIATDNRNIRVEQAVSMSEGEDSFASVSLTIEQAGQEGSNAEATVKQLIPVTFDVSGTRSTVDVDLQNGIAELAGHRLPLPPEQTRGHGFVSIPADTNESDNQFFFTFGATPPKRSVIVSDDAEVAGVLKLAAEIPTDEQSEHVAEIVSPDDVGSIRWDEVALVLWHAPIPADAPDSGDGVAIKSFVDRGGQIIFLPPSQLGAQSNAQSLFSMNWQAWQEPSEELAVATWRGDADLLSATLAGASLPVGKLRVSRFAGLDGDSTVLAKLADGSSLLARVATRQGGVYFLSTTPRREDSSLAADGVVLYVMVQRALAQGAKSLGNTRQFGAGQSDPAIATSWRRLAGDPDALSTENAYIAGVYQQPSDEHLIAINRIESEDAAWTLDDAQVSKLFDGLLLERIDQRGERSGSLIEEAWRAFLMVMLIAMIGEAILCLPRNRAAETGGFAGGMSA